MKLIDRRATPRFRVQYRTTLSGSGREEGFGTLHDVSVAGCCIKSNTSVRWGVPLELRIHVPNLEWPLMIDVGQIQWMRGDRFGVAFLEVKGAERQRLAEVIAELEKDCDDEETQIDMCMMRGA